MGIITTLRLEFVRQPGDYLLTSGLKLDGGTATFNLLVFWRPLLRALPPAEDEVTGAWFLTMTTATGVPIVTGAPMRDRTDALLGIATAGRPRGAIVPYDPKAPRPYTLGAWTTMGVALYYLPGGFVPDDFAA